MRVLSLFDGMACGMIAFKSLGIKIDSYDAYEIDKYAIQTATHNFPNIRENGDVFAADFKKYKGVDFVVGGSPCTYWSIAQKNNRETEASGLGWELFSQYLRAVKEAEPKYFIYENNYSMSAAIRESINKAFGFEAVFINSALVSAQTRKRLYWVGKRNADGTYSKVDVKQPKDRGILIKDILESGLFADPLRVGALSKIVSKDIKSIRVNDNYIQYDLSGKGYNSQDQRAYLLNTKHGALAASSGESKTGVIVPIRVGSLPRPNGELSTSQAKRVYSIDGKSVNLVANGGGDGAKTGLYAVPICHNIPQEVTVRKYTCDNDNIIMPADGKTKPIYEVKNGFITIKGKQYPIKLADGYYIIRKLTVTECKRLQTVPEWYEFPVSNAQAYKMLGNGWTVEVIAHLIRAALTNQTVEYKPEQISIFDII